MTVLEVSGETTLVLHGDNHMMLECGVDIWVDPGAQAGRVRPRWRCTSTTPGMTTGTGPGSQDPDDYGPGPNTSAEGTYSVQYIAWDAAGTR